MVNLGVVDMGGSLSRTEQIPGYAANLSRHDYLCQLKMGSAVHNQRLESLLHSACLYEPWDVILSDDIQPCVEYVRPVSGMPEAELHPQTANFRLKSRSHAWRFCSKWRSNLVSSCMSACLCAVEMLFYIACDVSEDTDIYLGRICFSRLRQCSSAIEDEGLQIGAAPL